MYFVVIRHRLFTRVGLKVVRWRGRVGGRELCCHRPVRLALGPRHLWIDVPGRPVRFGRWRGQGQSAGTRLPRPFDGLDGSNPESLAFGGFGFRLQCRHLRQTLRVRRRRAGNWVNVVLRSSWASHEHGGPKFYNSQKLNVLGCIAAIARCDLLLQTE